MDVCTPCVCSVHGGQKRESDTLELELWMDVNQLGPLQEQEVFINY